MKLVTVATRSEDYFPVLQDGADRLGYELVVLGWGQRWRGFAWRWSLLKTYLTTIPAGDVVVWCDAYDVFPVAPPQTVLQRFQAFGTPMVMSVENPDISMEEAYARRRMFGRQCRPNVYINGGLYMGYAGTLLEMIRVLEHIGFREGDDDQRLLNKLCRTAFMDKVAFDVESRIFFNVHDSDVAVIRTSAPQESFDACFIHGPGHTDLREIARKYGYTPPTYHSKATPGYIRRWIRQFGPVLYPEYIVSTGILCLWAYAVYRATKK